MPYSGAVDQQRLGALRGHFLLDRLDRWLRDSPLIVAHCAGSKALWGEPLWDREQLREPDRVALTVNGVILLLDIAPSRHRRRVVARWCRERSRTTAWRFHYRAVPIVPLLGGRGVIA